MSFSGCLAFIYSFMPLVAIQLMLEWIPFEKVLKYIWEKLICEVDIPSQKVYFSCEKELQRCVFSKTEGEVHSKGDPLLSPYQLTNLLGF